MSYFKVDRIMPDEQKRLGVLTDALQTLRYRAVIELDWAGCNDDKIMNYWGHKTKKLVSNTRDLPNKSCTPVRPQ